MYYCVVYNLTVITSDSVTKRQLLSITNHQMHAGVEVLYQQGVVFLSKLRFLLVSPYNSYQAEVCYMFNRTFQVPVFPLVSPNTPFRANHASK